MIHATIKTGSQYFIVSTIMPTRTKKRHFSRLDDAIRFLQNQGFKMTCVDEKGMKWFVRNSETYIYPEIHINNNRNIEGLGAIFQ